MFKCGLDFARIGRFFIDSPDVLETRVQEQHATRRWSYREGKEYNGLQNGSKGLKYKTADISLPAGDRLVQGRNVDALRGLHGQVFLASPYGNSALKKMCDNFKYYRLILHFICPCVYMHRYGIDPGTKQNVVLAQTRCAVPSPTNSSNHLKTSWCHFKEFPWLSTLQNISHDEDVENGRQTSGFRWAL